jgi:hypothetical protein
MPLTAGIHFSDNNNLEVSTMSYWDGMVIQYLSERVSFRVIDSNLLQLTNGTGLAAPLLHGFEGVGLGYGLDRHLGCES